MLRLLNASASRPLVVGHRGAMGHAPENTFGSFELAVAMGVDLIECDVHLTADGVPVVIHDHTLDRTTDAAGPVVDRTAAELAALDAGSWFGPAFAGERIPTLDALLAWCRDRVPVSIELKNGPIYYPDLTERVVDLVRSHRMEDSTFLISFDHHTILAAKHLAPEIAAGVLFVARPVDAVAVARAALADAILPHYAYATLDVVEQAHRAGVAVSVWTVNDDDAIRAVVSAGVDAVATNYPDRVLAALA